MESRDEETLELKETYSSLQQEVDIKTKKLKKVYKGNEARQRCLELWGKGLLAVCRAALLICLLPGFQLFSKLQAVKAEIHDLQEEHIKERQELEQTQNELTRELKLK